MIRVDVEQLTSLSRVVDPRYPSNRLVLAGAVLAGLGVGVATLLGADLEAGALSAAVGDFLAWAMARELDPDHSTSAALAMPVSLLLVLAVGPPALLVTLGVLLGVRVAAGTVGTPMRLLDSVTFIALSAALGTSLIGAVGAAAMISGALVSEPRSMNRVATAVMSAIAYTVVALITGLARTWTGPTPAEWITIGLAVAATLLLLPAAVPVSNTDRHTGTISRNRVTAARVIAGLAVVAALALTGGPGIMALAATGAAALVGTALRKLVRL